MAGLMHHHSSTRLRRGALTGLAAAVLIALAPPAWAATHSANAANVEPKVFGESANLRTQAGADKSKPAYLSEDQPLQLRDYDEPKPAEPASWWQQLLGFLFKLVLVLGLVAVTLAAIKRFGGGKLPSPMARGRNMVVLETTHLNPQQAIHLVSLGGERLLVVGASPQGLSALAEITDPEQVRPFLAGQKAPAASSFNQAFDLESVVQDANSELFNEAYRESFPRRKKGWPKP